MLGRLRPSSSSLDRLEVELERPPSKIIKDDSLSIYEITLQKLRLGSRRKLNSPSAEEMKIDDDVPCSSSASKSPSSSNGELTNISRPRMEDGSCADLSYPICKSESKNHEDNVVSYNIKSLLLKHKA